MCDLEFVSYLLEGKCIYEGPQGLGFSWKGSLPNQIMVDRRTPISKGDMGQY